MANRIAAMRVLADILAEEEFEKKSNGRGGFYMGDWEVTPSKLPDEIVGDDFTLKAGVSPHLCGTTLCAAGFATLNAGWSIKYERIVDKYTGRQMGVSATYYDPQGAIGKPEWRSVGAEYLGLGGLEAKVLFYSTDDHGEQAIEILERLAMGEDIPTEEWVRYGVEHSIDMEGFGYDSDGSLIDEDYDYNEGCDCSICQ